MTTFTNITDTEVQQSKPIRALTGRALRDNPIAIAEGDATAPRIQSAALQSRIAFDYSNLTQFGKAVYAGFVGVFKNFDKNMNGFVISPSKAATSVSHHAAPNGISAVVSGTTLRGYFGNNEIFNVGVGAAGGGSRQAFVANDENIYVCAPTTTAVRKYSATGTLIWSVSVTSNPSAIWVMPDDAYTVYAGDVDGRIYQITQTGGGSAASITATWTGLSSTNDVVDIVADTAGFLYAAFDTGSQGEVLKVDPSDGSAVWAGAFTTTNRARSLAMLSSSLLVLGTASSQRVFGINPSTGAQLWETTPSGDGIVCVAVNPQGIIAASNSAGTSGQIHFLNSAGTLLASNTTAASEPNYSRCELGDYAHHWNDIDPEA